MFYAKTDPMQNILEHTEELIKRINKIKELYGPQIAKKVGNDVEEFWKVLECACKYHDFGKVYTPFQNLILKNIGKNQIHTIFSYEMVKHEQLSPLFIPYNLDIKKEHIKVIYQAIYFHHNRYGIVINSEYKQYIKQIIDMDIMPNIENIKKELKFEINENISTNCLDKINYRNQIFEYIGKNKELYIYYVLIKGLLNRLDYSASSGYEIEEDSKASILKCTEDFFELIIKRKPNELQNFCKENSDSNLLIIGSTGIGKTEAALLWSGNSKSFFTLPLVVSINAIYDRIKEKMGYENVGLLHGSSLEYIESKEVDNAYMMYEQSKELASKFTVCTIDQIFTFVFKCRGYERIYATMSYSKIIIDEIQAYSPNIVAVILKGIEMINNIGGRFMIMTATLPTIYKDYLKEKNIKFKEGTYIKDINRHRVKTINKSILEDIAVICQKGKENKVLVIVNTVNRAIELYDKIKTKNKNVKLLHARFIQKDKARLEKEIKEFSDSENGKGIWITTQIVEASLDISFDILYTELSTLDSVFQRMGRCYRNKEYMLKEPNILIYTSQVSGIGKRSVYDEEIHKKSVEMIENYNGEFLLEEEKIDMVKKLYSKESLKDSEFLKIFNESIEQFENLENNDISKLQAEKELRNIESIRVIPRTIFDEISELFEEYKEETDNKKKNKIKRTIELYSINVRISMLQGDFIKAPNINNIYITNLKYSQNTGLIIANKSKLEVKDRIF
ncbi:MAG: CRISPR-associated helicase Cas3' [Clostridia bacterium]